MSEKRSELLSAGLDRTSTPLQQQQQRTFDQDTDDVATAAAELQRRVRSMVAAHFAGSLDAAERALTEGGDSAVFEALAWEETGPNLKDLKSIQDVIDSILEASALGRTFGFMEGFHSKLREVSAGRAAVQETSEAFVELFQSEIERLSGMNALPDTERCTQATSQLLPFLTPVSNTGSPVAPDHSTASIDAYFAQISRNLLPSACTESWTEHRYFYRCKDCSLSAAGSICTACFSKGDHTGHDFVFEKSSFGGCCDCGNSQVWKPSGFCSDHAERPPHARGNLLAAIPDPVMRVVSVGVFDYVERLLEHAGLFLCDAIKVFQFERDRDVVRPMSASQGDPALQELFDGFDRAPEDQGEMMGDSDDEYHDAVSGDDEYADAVSGDDPNESGETNEGGGVYAEIEGDDDETDDDSSHSGDSGYVSRARRKANTHDDNATTLSIPSTILSSLLSLFREFGQRAEIFMQITRRLLLRRAGPLAASWILGKRSAASISYANLLTPDGKSWEPDRASVLLESCIAATYLKHDLEGSITDTLYLFLDLLLDSDFKASFLSSYVCSYRDLVKSMIANNGEVNIVYKLSPQLLCMNSLVADSAVRRLALVEACLVAVAEMFAFFPRDFSMYDTLLLPARVSTASKVVSRRWFYAFTNDVNMLCLVPEISRDILASRPQLLSTYVSKCLLPCHYIDSYARQLTVPEYDLSNFQSAYALEWEMSRTSNAIADIGVKALFTAIQSDSRNREGPGRELISRLFPAFGLLSQVLLELPTTQMIRGGRPLVSDTLVVSLHLPIHRFFSRLIASSLAQISTVSSSTEPRETVSTLLQLPLESLRLICTPVLICFVMCGQQRVGLWIKNGNGFALNCQLYAGNYYHDKLQQDIFLLQSCLSAHDDFSQAWDWFCHWFEVEIFGWPLSRDLGQLVTLPLLTKASIAAVENLLRLWRELQVETQRAGMPLEQRIRRELISQLAAHDGKGLTYSEVHTILDEEINDVGSSSGQEGRERANRLHETALRILDEVATEARSDGTQPARYVLREACWTEVDLSYRFTSDRNSNTARGGVDRRLHSNPTFHTHNLLGDRPSFMLRLTPLFGPLTRLREALFIEPVLYTMLTALSGLCRNEPDSSDVSLRTQHESLLGVVCDLLCIMLDNGDLAIPSTFSYFPSNSLLENVRFVDPSSIVGDKSILVLLCDLVRMEQDRRAVVFPVLRRLCVQPENVAIIRDHIPDMVCQCGPTAEMSDGPEVATPAELRKLRMKQQQQRIMMQMQQKQASFLSASSEGDHDMADAPQQKPTESTPNPTCALCHKPGHYFSVASGVSDDDASSSLGLVAMLLSVCRGSHDKKLPSSDPRFGEWWKSTRTSDSSLRSSMDKLPGPGCDVLRGPELPASANPEEDARVRVISCGHTIHPACYASFQKQMLADYSEEYLRIDHERPDALRGEFRCPVCRRLSNALLPHFDSTSDGKLMSPSTLFEFFQETSAEIEATEGAAIVGSAFNGGAEIYDLDVTVSPASLSVLSIDLLGKTGNRILEVASNRHRNEFYNSSIRREEEVDIQLALPVFVFASTVNLQAVECVLRHLQSTSSVEDTASHEKDMKTLRLLMAGCADSSSAFGAQRSMSLAQSSFFSVFADSERVDLEPGSWTQVRRVLTAETMTSLAQCVLPLPFPSLELIRPRLNLLAKLVGVFYGITVVQSLYLALGLDVQMALGPRALLETELPDEVIRLAEEACVPFLRFSTLLLEGLCHDSSAEGGSSLLPSLSFDVQASHLRLPSIRQILDALGIASAPPLPIQAQVAVQVVQSCFRAAELAPEGLDRQFTIPPLLSTSFRERDAFRLIALPETFQELLIVCSQSNCATCNERPDEMALCLFCGRLLCCASQCCSWPFAEDDETARHDRLHECYRHFSQSRCTACVRGSGGLFLLLRGAHALIIWENRYAVWRSLYVDDHGEEDYDLRRGKTLFLNHARLDELRDIWVAQRFDREPSVASKMMRSAHLL